MPGVRAERAALLVHDLALLCGQARSGEEVPVVASRQEACLLALGSTRGLEPRVRCLLARLRLGLSAEREPHPFELGGVEPGEHVRLVLALVQRAGEQAAAPMFGDARVVARREARGPGAGGEGEQFGEAEAAVAADARVRRLAVGVAGDEGVHDGRAELAPEIERDMRQAEPVARLARGQDGLGRAAGTLGVGAGRVEPEPQRDANRVLPRPQERDGAVHAAAHRHGHALRRVRRGEDGPERVRERVHGEGLTADRGRLEQR